MDVEMALLKLDDELEAVTISLPLAPKVAEDVEFVLELVVLLVASFDMAGRTSLDGAFKPDGFVTCDAALLSDDILYFFFK